MFCVALQSTCTLRKRRGKTPRQIHYLSYCGWALKVMKIQREDTFRHYSYPEEILNYIRALVPNKIKGEILEDSCKVSLKEFCEVLQIIMFHWQSLLEELLEKVCGKICFLVKLHSVITSTLILHPIIYVSWIISWRLFSL